MTKRHEDRRENEQHKRVSFTFANSKYLERTTKADLSYSRIGRGDQMRRRAG